MKGRVISTELIVINENKLKVMLSDEEMIKYDIDRLGDGAVQGTRRAFRNMIDEIKNRTGFDADSTKLCIQLYPCHSGGCELYLTRLCGTDSVYENASPDDTKFDYSELATTDFDRIRGDVYGFENLAELISVCRAFDIRFPARTATAYIDDSGGTMLVFENKLSEKERSLIEEFGQSQRGEAVRKYIPEHCLRLFDGNAVSALAVFW